MICEKQDAINSYISMGRHRKVDCFFPAQPYYRVFKQLIRYNANVIIIFKQDGMNLQHIYSVDVSPNIRFIQFKKLCGHYWKDEFGFMLIDKDGELNDGGYRKEFDNFKFVEAVSEEESISSQIAGSVQWQIFE